MAILLLAREKVLIRILPRSSYSDEFRLQFRFLAQLISLSGFIALWRWPVFGGISSLVGISAFYPTNYEVSGRFPGGWVFPLFFVPGILTLLSWAIDRACPDYCPARR